MYTIGRLARRARVKADSIRFYERQGLISPTSKTASGYRLYTDAAIRRLAFIKQAQRCGFSLADIGELLQIDIDHTARGARYRLAAEKKAEIDGTIAALQAMSNALTLLLADSGEKGALEKKPADESRLLTAMETCLADQRKAVSTRTAAATPGPPLRK